MSPIQALDPWRAFYALLGSASATMVGLLFVAVSVASGVFSQDRQPAALRIFLSATVVHFSSILAACLIVQAPVQNSDLLGAMIGACGLVGIAYSGIAWRDTVRAGLSARIDLEDRIWYAILPAIGYLCEVGSGITLAMRADIGCSALAVSVGILLVVSIHNAWDITVWSVTRPPK